MTFNRHMTYNLTVLLVVLVLIVRLVAPFGSLLTVRAQVGELALGAAVLTNPYFLGVLALVAVGGYVIYDIETDGPISTWFEHSEDWSSVVRQFMLGVFAQWIVSQDWLKLNPNAIGVNSFYDALSGALAGSWVSVGTMSLDISGYGYSMDAYSMVEPPAGTYVYVDVPAPYSCASAYFPNCVAKPSSVVFGLYRPSSEYGGSYYVAGYKGSEFSRHVENGGYYISNPPSLVSFNPTVSEFPGWSGRVSMVVEPYSTGGTHVFGYGSRARLWVPEFNDGTYLGGSYVWLPVHIGEAVGVDNYPSFWGGDYAIAVPSSADDIFGRNENGLSASPWVKPIEDILPGERVWDPAYAPDVPVEISPPAVEVPTEWEGLQGLWDWLASTWQDFIDWLTNVWNKIGTWWNSLTGFLSNIVTAINAVKLWLIGAWDTVIDIYDWLIALPDTVVGWFTPTITLQARIAALEAEAVGRFPLAIAPILNCVLGIFDGGSADLVITMPDGFGSTYDMVLPAPTGGFAAILYNVSTFAALLTGVLYLVYLVRRFLH